MPDLDETIAGTECEYDELEGLAPVVAAIRAYAPELADDLDDAIGVWTEFYGLAVTTGARSPSALDGRRSRLSALATALAVQPYEPDPRD